MFSIILSLFVINYIIDQLCCHVFTTIICLSLANHIHYAQNFNLSSGIFAMIFAECLCSAFDLHTIAKSCNLWITPRVCNQQTFRSNIATDDVSAHVKRTMSIPFLDHLLTELSACFTNENCITSKAMYVVPAIKQKQYHSSVGEQRSLLDENSVQLEEILENQS